MSEVETCPVCLRFPCCDPLLHVGMVELYASVRRRMSEAMDAEVARVLSTR